MTGNQVTTETLLTSALIASTPWHPEAQPSEVVERALFHGIAGALIPHIREWPEEVFERLRSAAMAQAMWEMRHRRVLQGLLKALSVAGIRVILLKGSALAYDLYPEPTYRSRGDTDLLIDRTDLTAARKILSAQKFSPFMSDSSVREAVAMEEHWQLRTSDQFIHEVDLHWQALNAVALAHVIPFEAAWKRALPLPRLSPDAFGLPRDLALLHACAHRAKHAFSPYFVEGKVYFNGDRLIWLRDIDLLVRALDSLGWVDFEREAIASGLTSVAIEALDASVRRLGTPLPEGLLARLQAAPKEGSADRYLLASLQAERAWRDIRAVSGLRNRSAFLWNRLLPGAAFMRTKYPDLAHRPLPFLYLRRLAEFLHPRRKQGN